MPHPSPSLAPAPARDGRSAQPAMPIRVGLVEDDTKVRKALEEHVAAQPDLVLVWSADSCADALTQLPLQQVDVLLVDLGLPDGSGLEVIRAARSVWPDCSVLVSTIFGDEAHVLPSIEAGAVGYLLKDNSAPGMAEEIRSVHAGGSPISPMVARKILARAAVAPAPEQPPIQEGGDTLAPQAVALSAREREVLQLVSKGFTTEETAAALDISSSTAQTFVRRIYAKLQVRTRAAAIHAAHRHGLLGD